MMERLYLHKEYDILIYSRKFYKGYDIYSGKAIKEYFKIYGMLKEHHKTYGILH